MSIVLKDTRASFDSRYFGASIEKGLITIWKSDTATPITTVQPGFSGGQNRHAIDPINRFIYSGTWEEGLTCFDYDDNRIVWHRNDLIGIQNVYLSAGFPASVFVTLEGPDHRLYEPGIISGIVELASQDGRTKWTTEEGDWVHADPLQPLLVTIRRSSRSGRILDAAKNQIGSILMTHFALNDVGFSKDMIALAEGEKGVRILDHKGALISQYVPKTRTPNCLRVAFFEDHLIVFDSWKGSFVTIIEPHTRKVVTEYKRNSHGTICFIDSGSRFVDPFGHVCCTANGQTEKTLKAK